MIANGSFDYWMIIDKIIPTTIAEEPKNEYKI